MQGSPTFRSEQPCYCINETCNESYNGIKQSISISISISISVSVSRPTTLICKTIPRPPPTQRLTKNQGPTHQTTIFPFSVSST